MTSKDVLLFITFLFSTTFALFLVPKIKNFAKRNGVFDHPCERKLHTNRTPLLGGLAIWITISMSMIFALGSLLFLGKIPEVESLFPGLQFWLQEVIEGYPTILAIGIAACGIAVLGIFDDLKRTGFHYLTKFIIQFVFVGVLVMNGITIHIFPWPWLNVLITFFWIVGITNALNMLDGMDGIAAGVAAISAAGLLFVTMGNQPIYVSLLLISLIGSCIGFLRYNFSPAKIFMGDTGSLFLGFLLSTLAIVCLNSLNSNMMNPSAIFPILILSIPVFDTFYVTTIRLRKGLHVFVGDQNHYYHRLKRLFKSTTKAAFTIYALNIIAVVTTFFVFRVNWLGSLLIIAFIISLYSSIPNIIALYYRKASLSTYLPFTELLKAKDVILHGEDGKLDVKPGFKKYIDQRKEMETTVES